MAPQGESAAALGARWNRPTTDHRFFRKAHQVDMQHASEKADGPQWLQFWPSESPSQSEAQPQAAQEPPAQRDDADNDIDRRD